MVPFPDLRRIPHRHCGFDDHHSRRVDVQDFFNDIFHRRRVEEIFLRVIVGGSGNDDIGSVCKGVLGIQSSSEPDILPQKEMSDICIHQRRSACVEHLYFFRRNVQRHHFLVLGQQEPVGKAHIAGACNRDFHKNGSFPAIGLLYHKKGGVARSVQHPLSCRAA